MLYWVPMESVRVVGAPETACGRPVKYYLTLPYGVTILLVTGSLVRVYRLP